MATVIICPSCGTRFETKADIPPEGRKVRCSKCSTVWLARPEPQGGAMRGPASQPPGARPAPPKPGAPGFAPGQGGMAASPGGPRQQPMGAPRPPLGGQRGPGAGAARPMGGPGMPGGQRPNGDGRMAPGAGTGVPDSGYGQQRDAGFGAFPEMDDEYASQDAGFGTFPQDEGAYEQGGGDASFEYYGEPRSRSTELVPDTRYQDGAPRVNLPSERRAKPRGGVMLLAGWGVLALIVLAILGAFFTMRTSIAAALPGSTRIYAALGMPVTRSDLTFENVHYAWNRYEGQQMLQVEGTVRNDSDHDMSVPNVLIALLDETGGTISEWMSPATDKPLAPGATTPFATQIPTPPATTHSFRVRFQKQS